MTHDNSFAVSRFENRNGTTSWRVSGSLAGVRIRKNFPSREEAAAEKSSLELRAAQATSGQRSVATSLSNDQVREAEAAFRRLVGAPKPLAFYLDYALTNYRAPDRDQTLAAAVAEYMASKSRECDRSLISACQVNNIRKELVLLQAHFPRCSVAQLTASQLQAFCERGIPSLKSQNNRRGLLGTFFKFALQKDWIAKNPVDKVPHHRIAHRRGSAQTLTVQRAADLMAHVEAYRGGALVPFLALCLFAGIRPCVRTGEIAKLRADHVRLDTGIIHIEPEVSKVRMKRNVTIQPNLAAWLRAYPLHLFPIIIPANLQNIRARIAKEFGLSHDIMRHTFISMHVAKFRSMGEAALQAGNSESIIRKHYLDLKTPAEAEAFFNIMPAGQAAAHPEPLAFPEPRPALAATG